VAELSPTSSGDQQSGGRAARRSDSRPRLFSPIKVSRNVTPWEKAREARSRVIGLFTAASSARLSARSAGERQRAAKTGALKRRKKASRHHPRYVSLVNITYDDFHGAFSRLGTLPVDVKAGKRTRADYPGESIARLFFLFPIGALALVSGLDVTSPLPPANVPAVKVSLDRSDRDRNIDEISRRTKTTISAICAE
jgi:hypothetical protein